MPVAARLKKYCKENNITQESLVIKGFGTKQTINNYLNGKTEAKAGFLEMFIKEFRLSANWLMTGEEDSFSGKVIFKENDQINVIEEPCPCCDKLKAEKMKLLEELNELNAKYRYLLETGEIKKEINSETSKKVS